MSEITVRALGEDDWETYREVRLAALEESPDAFVADKADEEGKSEQFWRERMNRSRRLLAEADGGRVGVVSIGSSPEKPDEETDDSAGQLFGLWVAPEWRGRSVAATLVREASKDAKGRGLRRLFYWVGTDNPRAVAFASSFGFRPTDDRRPMRTHSDDGEEEIAMVLALGEDRGDG